MSNARLTRPPVVKLSATEAPLSMWRFVPAALGSALFHICLLGLLFFIISSTQARSIPEPAVIEGGADVESVDRMKKDPFLTGDVDLAVQEFDTDIQFNVQRKEDFSIPGLVSPNEALGILNAPKEAPPINLPAPAGFAMKGQGAAMTGPEPGTGTSIGQLGGYGPNGMPLAGTFYGRSAATREFALREGGGTGESEAAVARGLQWLAKAQMTDGRWPINGKFKNPGNVNDNIAGTALGLLPFLGAGKTHKAAERDANNPYQRNIEKGLLFLIKSQDKSSGSLMGAHDMYSHGLASIVLCEAYGLTQDPALRKPAQSAINFIVQAQHDGGGWRYQPRTRGDLSVTGWQVMALKSAQMAGLDVPELTLRKAYRFLELVCNSDDETYGYTDTNAVTPATNAVGLLCRQYVQGWGPKNGRLIRGIDNLRGVPPGTSQNIYYEYYATQVMHHVGGDTWKKWNEPMREHLIRTQDKSTDEGGSWFSQADRRGSAGGRLMQTSLSLLTLEVYYRYLPLYYRETGEGMEALANGK